MSVWLITEPLWVDFDVEIPVSSDPHRFAGKPPVNKGKIGLSRAFAKDELERLLVKENLSFGEVAKRLELSVITVRRWCRTLKIGRYAQKTKKVRPLSASSQVPFGWTQIQGVLQKDQKEMRWVELARKMRLRGESYHSIARHFQSRGVSTKNGGKWHAKTISQILEFNDQHLAHARQEKK